jgi:hypothetical protein
LLIQSDLAEPTMRQGKESTTDNKPGRANDESEGGGGRRTGGCNNSLTGLSTNQSASPPKARRAGASSRRLSSSLPSSTRSFVLMQQRALLKSVMLHCCWCEAGPRLNINQPPGRALPLAQLAALRSPVGQGARSGCDLSPHRVVQITRWHMGVD